MMIGLQLYMIMNVDLGLVVYFLSFIKKYFYVTVCVR